jgi:hypothetical protein
MSSEEEGFSCKERLRGKLCGGEGGRFKFSSSPGSAIFSKITTINEYR